MSEPVISLREVSKSFSGNAVLRRASLEVGRGETVAILGASGSGKSVTLKAVNGLVRVDEGRVEVLGHQVTELDENRLAPLRQRVSYLFQWGALFDSMNVFDNIAFPLREHRRMEPEALRERVEELLAMVQLGAIGDRFPAQLSGGMRKRVAVARALALEPEIILYDEPTTGLDPVTGAAIADMILELDRRTAITSVVVTHDIPLVMRVAERVVFLHDGRFIFSGSLDEARHTAPPELRRFFTAGGVHA